MIKHNKKLKEAYRKGGIHSKEFTKELGKVVKKSLKNAPSIVKDYFENIDIMKCYKCGKKLKPITEKNGKKSKYSFSCECSPDLILSIG